MAQAAIVADALATFIGPVEIVPIATRGDAISVQRPSAGWVETDGQFTHELEGALLDGDVDLAVHSFKDLPTAPVDGLVIGAVLARADARDCLVTRDGSGLEDLPFGAWIGTSSPRRAAQLAAVRSDLIAMPIRGNVETRLRRLDAGDFDAVVLAAAGLDRIGIPVAESARLPFDLMLPAPAQGALVVQVRSIATALRAAVMAADHAPTRVAVEAERALLRRIGGGCLAPLGALGEVSDSRLRLRAAYEDADGAHHRAEATGPVERAGAVIDEVADAVRSA